MIMSADVQTRMSLHEATNIGNQLLAMGRVTHDQLQQAQQAYTEAIDSGRKVRIGDILKELGFCSEDDLYEAQLRQQKARDTHPENHDETCDALKILRQTMHAYERSSATRLAALSNPFIRIPKTR